jgi:Protein of unknown function (DUF1016).
MSLLIDDSEYLKTIEAIKQDIKAARYKAVLSVNSTLIFLYYHIGQVINEYKSWENKFVDNLSRDIKLEFPDSVIIQEVLAQLPWYSNYCECRRKIFT